MPKRNMKKKSFEFAHRVEVGLSEEEKQHYVRYMQSLVTNLLNVSQTHLEMHKKTKQVEYPLAVSAQVTCSMDECVTLMRSETSEAFAEKSRLWHPDLVDAKLICIISKDATTDPVWKKCFCSVKWMGWATPPMVKPRDICVLEYTGIKVDVDGNETGFYAMESLNRAQTSPAILTDNKFIRANVQHSYIFRQSKLNRSRVNVNVQGYFDPQGWVPEWYCNMRFRLFKKRFELYVSLLNPLPLDLQLQSNKSTTHCKLCSNTFNITRSKKNCQFCGEVFCSKCILKRTQVETKNSEIIVSSVKICVRCMNDFDSRRSSLGNSQNDSKANITAIMHAPPGEVDDEEEHIDNIESQPSIFDKEIFNFEQMSNSISEQKQLLDFMKKKSLSKEVEI